jgi:anion transporter
MSSVIEYATTSPHTRATAPPRSVQRRHLLSLPVLVAAWAAIGWLYFRGEGLSASAAVTLAVFAAAVWLWVFTGLDDSFVALAAAAVLTLAGVTDTDALFATLGDDVVWLLLAAFVIATGVASSGLATRATAALVAAARSPRGLFHLVAAALVVTTFAVPSTSGRAALALPVFTALAAALRQWPRLVRALTVLFPTVILLSAVGSLLGAGAHLITSQIVDAATGSGFGFVTWLILGLPLAVVASHAATEIVLALFTCGADRRRRLTITVADLQVQSGLPLSGRWSSAERRSALLLAAVVALWCTEPWHGVHPALVALVGALIAASPRYGTVQLPAAIAAVPWSLLLFMAATMSLGTALKASGAAQWLADGALGALSNAGKDGAHVFVVVVVLVSTSAHLAIQSRSARSAVLVPIVVVLAPTVGVDPAAAAFLSTAAGFCHTLTSSAKPVALFSCVAQAPTYSARDLLRLSAVLAPVNVLLVLGFGYLVWPSLGLPLNVD